MTNLKIPKNVCNSIRLVAAAYLYLSSASYSLSPVAAGPPVKLRHVPVYRFTLPGDSNFLSGSSVHSS
jgi:hypothetical protein